MTARLLPYIPDPSEKESTLKRKNEFPTEANVFLLEQTNFQK